MAPRCFPAPDFSRAAALLLTGAASAGYFYPDEAMPHERTFMQWPVNTQIHEDPAFLQSSAEDDQ
jgi:hypothetical protein